MSILETTSSAIEPTELGRVRAVAAAILQLQGYSGEDLVELVISDAKPRPASLGEAQRYRRAEAAVIAAAQIVNYLRGEYGGDVIDLELLAALRREASL